MRVLTMARVKKPCVFDVHTPALKDCYFRSAFVEGFRGWRAQRR